MTDELHRRLTPIFNRIRDAKGFVEGGFNGRASDELDTAIDDFRELLYGPAEDDPAERPLSIEADAFGPTATPDDDAPSDNWPMLTKSVASARLASDPRLPHRRPAAEPMPSFVMDFTGKGGR